MKLKGQRIIEFCAIYFDMYNKSVPDKEIGLVDDHRFLLFNLMDKLVELFSGVGEMMVLCDEKKFLKTSLFLVVRGALHDVIQAQWLFSKMKPNTPEDEQHDLHCAVDMINRDHIAQHLIFLQKMEKFNSYLDAKDKFQVSAELEILNHNYIDILGVQVHDLSNFKSKSLSTMTIGGMLNLETINIPDLRAAYILYSFYSKMEHTGILTSEIRVFNYQKNDLLDSYFRSSLGLIQNTIVVLATSYFQDKAFQEKFRTFKIL